MSTVSNRIKIIVLSLIIALVAGGMVFTVRTYAAGDFYLSEQYITIREGESYSIAVSSWNAAGKYSVYSDGTASAYGGGWLDSGDNAMITVYGAGVGSGSVTVNLDDVATYDAEQLGGSRTVYVNVIPAESGYSGGDRGGGEQQAAAEEAVQEEEQEQPQAEEKAKTDKRKVVIDNVEYSVLDDLTGIGTPAGFTVKDGKYNGENVKTLTFGKDLVIYVLKRTDNGVLSYKVLKGKDFQDPVIVYQSGRMYYVLDLEEGYKIPEGYKAKDVKVGNGTVKGFVSGDAKLADFSYARVMKDGETGIYAYDTKEGSLQRAIDILTIDQTKSQVKSPGETAKELEAQRKEKALKIGIVDAVVLLMIMAVTAVIIYIKKKKRRTVDDIFNEDI